MNITTATTPAHAPDTVSTELQIKAQEAILKIETTLEEIKFRVRNAHPNKIALAVIRCSCLDMQKHLDDVYYWSTKEYREELK